MKPMRILSLAIVCGLVSSASAWAAEGVLLATRTTSGESTITSQMQIERTRMRAEVADPSGNRQILIFDAGKQVMLIVNTARKTYMELTKTDLDAMRTQMDAMMANIPAAQRAQMEAMMRGRGMGPGERTEYKRAGTDKAGKWTCDKYEGFRAGQKASELCTVEPSTLGFTAADFSVTRQMADFVASVLPQAADQVMAIGAAEATGFSGLPVRTTAIMGGRTMTTEVTEARRDTFADALFAVPAGFQKDAMPMMMGGRGGRGQ